MLYDTWLFVPAVVRYLSNFDSIIADNIIFDLEDSIREDDKEEALKRLSIILSKYSSHKRRIYIRINSGIVGIKDIKTLNKYSFAGYIIPKIEDGNDLHDYTPYIGEKKIIALVESVAGIVNIESIASSPHIYGVAFGGEDYCKELGVETNDSALRYPRERIVLYARHYKKYSLDTISMEYKDLGKFSCQLKESLAIGFDSKLLIHPAQVNAVYDLAEDIDIDTMKVIVRQYETSQNGLININGHWYEKPHIERIKSQIRQMEEKPSEK